MKRRVILFSILLLLLAAGLYGYKEYNRTNEDLISSKSLFNIDAPSLIMAYEQDQAGFNKKFTDKIITVEGKVKQIDASENPVVISIGNSDEFSSVQCSMDSSHAEMYSGIKEGDRVLLKGIVTGGRTEEMFGTDVVLNRCVIEN